MNSSESASFKADNLSAAPDGYGGEIFSGEISVAKDSARVREQSSQLNVSLVLRDDAGAIIYGFDTYVDWPPEGGSRPFSMDVFDPPAYDSFECTRSRGDGHGCASVPVRVQVVVVEAEVVADLVQHGFANLPHQLRPRAADPLMRTLEDRDDVRQNAAVAGGAPAAAARPDTVPAARRAGSAMVPRSRSVGSSATVMAMLCSTALNRSGTPSSASATAASNSSSLIRMPVTVRSGRSRPCSWNPSAARPAPRRNRRCRSGR